MPALPLANTFEDGIDGVAIAPENSGANSGDRFQNVRGSPFATFTSLQRRGRLGMRVVNATASASVEHTGFGSLTGSVFVRFYVYLTAFPASGTQATVLFLQDAAAARSTGLVIRSTGLLAGMLAAGTLVGTGTRLLALNTWVRIEGRFLPSATVGEIEWRFFNDTDGLIATESNLVTGLVLGANIDGARYGLQSTTPTAPFTIGIEDVAASSAGWIGPSPTPAPAVAFE